MRISKMLIRAAVPHLEEPGSDGQFAGPIRQINCTLNVRIRAVKTAHGP